MEWECFLVIRGYGLFHRQSPPWPATQFPYRQHPLPRTLIFAITLLMPDRRFNKHAVTVRSPRPGAKGRHRLQLSGLRR